MQQAPGALHTGFPMLQDQTSHNSILVLGNLVHFLLADGRIDDRELILLRDASDRLGLRLSVDRSTWRELAELRDAGNDPETHMGLLCLAESFAMMQCDGEIHQAERRAWVQLAVWFGYPQPTARSSLRILESDILEQVPSEVVARAIAILRETLGPKNSGD